MKRSTFLEHYNFQTNRNPSKLLIVADSKVNKDFVNELCDRLNINADLLYIDTSRKTRKSVTARHLSYLILAKQALLMGYKYDNVIFWQQFIGLYWSIFSSLKRGTRVGTFLLPLIYKPRKLLIGRMYKLFFSFSLANSALWGAICHSSEELIFYQIIFPKCKNKMFFVPYGRSSEAKEVNLPNINITIPEDIPYFFSGGTSNRDYSTLMSVAAKMKYNFVLACTRKDIKGMNIPDNVKVFHDAYDEKFNSLMQSSYAVVLTLENPDISSGQIVLLKAMEMGKLIIVTRSAGTIDYVDETCAFFVEPKNVEQFQKVLNLIIENPEKAQVRATKAKKRYQEKYSTKKFASHLAELIAKQNRIRALSC